MLGTNIKIKFKYLVAMANSTDSTSSRRSEMTFCVSSLRIEIYLCGCLQDEMRRVYSWGGGERNETKTKWRGGS